MKKLISFLLLIVSIGVNAQSFMMNPYGRQNTTLFNGKWNAIIDLYSNGEKKKFYQNRKPQHKTEFIEYSFENGLRLNVPGDLNSQMPELKYYEGNIWYQRYFTVKKNNDKRQFLYFVAVSYEAVVWLNGVELGRHEGGFTPFQFEVTNKLKDGKNDLVIMVNNNRRVDGIPAMSFDWWNYGGITRDVFLIETPQSYILDYKIQLKKGSDKILSGFVQLDGVNTSQQVKLSIPELKINKTITTNKSGYATFEIAAKPQLWSPDAPKMYEVKFIANGDIVKDKMGFRTIETEGAKILLNGEPIFLKGVNFHEEIPQRMGRAYSDADAAMILNEVKALGCNFARTAHYPQNERILRMAEEMGIMIWEEIPIWQGIEFTNPVIYKKAETMLREMIYRDKNRSNVIIWSVANETKPSPARDSILTKLVTLTRSIDNTRLVSAAFNNSYFKKDRNTFELKDKLTDVLDVVGINKYVGWYQPFRAAPEELKWIAAPNKPLIFSEFGSEALYGQHGEADVASSWSEEYQEQNYKNNLTLQKNIKNLCGIAPWVLFDFRSPNRFHQRNQEGWNRKGLVSDKGQRKKAWYVIKDYYSQIK